MIKLLMTLLVISTGIQAGAESLAIVDKADGNLTLVNVITNERTTINVGYLPHEVAVSQQYAFVSNYGHQHVRSFSLKNKPGNTLSVIRLSDSTLVKEIELGSSGCAPHGVEVSADDKYLFATCEGRQEIAVIDVQRLEVLKFLRTNQPGSHMLAVGNDGLLFVTNFWIGTVSVIDIESGELRKQMFTGRSTEGIGLSPDGKSLFITVVESNELVKISVESLEIQKRVQLPEKMSPIRVLVSNDNTKIIVNHAADNSTGIYDSETLQLIRNLPVGQQPIGLAVSRKQDLAYAANMRSGSISVINISSAEVSKTLDLQMNAPDGLTVIK